MRSSRSKKWRSKTHRLQAKYYPRRDGVVRRVVLDTNVGWYAPITSLKNLKDAGFLLSLSSIAMNERWARAAREGKPELLNRAQALEKLLDPAMRFAFVGTTLEDQLGCLAPGRPDDERYHREKTAYEEAWRQVLRGEHHDWQELGAEVDAQLNEHAGGWLAELLGQRRRLKATTPTTESDRDHLQDLSEEGAIEMSVRHLVDTTRTGLPGGAKERLDASMRVFAIHHWRALTGEETPAANSYEDGRLLLHLAAPVFVATDDAKLIQRVDQTRSYQAPWVRRPLDLLRDDLPRGVPWGDGARRVAAQFDRAALG